MEGGRMKGRGEEGREVEGRVRRIGGRREGRRGAGAKGRDDGEKREAGEGGGCTQFVHGRSRRTIGPRGGRGGGEYDISFYAEVRF